MRKLIRAGRHSTDVQKRRPIGRRQSTSLKEPRNRGVGLFWSSRARHGCWAPLAPVRAVHPLVTVICTPLPWRSVQARSPRTGRRLRAVVCVVRGDLSEANLSRRAERTHLENCVPAW